MHADMSGFVMKLFICIYYDLSKRMGDVRAEIEVGGI